MGKWATYRRRGSSKSFGSMSAPGAVDVDWTAAPGASGVITVARLAAVPAGATSMLWRTINNTTNIPFHFGNATLTGLIPDEEYRVSASWWNGSKRVSEWSAQTVVAAGA